MSVRKQRGAALIAAVLVVALATVLIAAMLDRSEAALARTRNLQRAEQGWELMRGVEAWAGEILKKDFNEAPNIDSRLDIWNQEMPPIDLPGVRIFGRLSERNGCFNLNALHPQGEDDSAAIARFERLLRALKLDPHFEDAAYNAELVRAALAERDRYDPLTIDKQAREMEQLEDRDQRSAEESRGEGSDSPEAEERAGGDSEKPTESSAEPGQRGGSEPSKASGEEGGGRSEDGGGEVERGAESDGEAQTTQSGDSADEGIREEELDSQARRVELENAAATEQWLRRIVDDPAQFLSARITREFRRRKAVGEAPPDSEDAW